MWPKKHMWKRIPYLMHLHETPWKGYKISNVEHDFQLYMQAVMTKAQ